MMIIHQSSLATLHTLEKIELIDEITYDNVFSVNG